MSNDPVTLAADNRAIRFWLAAAAAFILVQIVTLALMGRIPICECGHIKLFEPGVNTAGNSQHISDWYTPSHIIHGFLFYWLAMVTLPRASFGARLTLSVVVEAAWELLENSPIIIERYRTATMAIGYTGDSVLNSAMDTMAMVLGFMFAARAPVWLTIALAIGFEIVTAIVIRDNLTLNVLMLVWPLDAVREWQAAL